jgi:hypothetical protein
VVVAWSKVGTVRRVVKQDQVEMLQQCSSASSCMWTHSVSEEPSTECQHSGPFVPNGPMQFLPNPFFCAKLVIA